MQSLRKSRAFWLQTKVLVRQYRALFTKFYGSFAEVYVRTHACVDPIHTCSLCGNLGRFFEIVWLFGGNICAHACVPRTHTSMQPLRKPRAFWWKSSALLRNRMALWQKYTRCIHVCPDCVPARSFCGNPGLFDGNLRHLQEFRALLRNDMALLQKSLYACMHAGTTAMLSCRNLVLLCYKTLHCGAL